MAVKSSATEERSEAEPRHGDAKQFVEMQRRGYEVNCCAAALRSTDGQGEGIASRAMRREGMAKKSADVICEGKVVHRNDSLRQGFASDALAWKREEMP